MTGVGQLFCDEIEAAAKEAAKAAKQEARQEAKQEAVQKARPTAWNLLCKGVEANTVAECVGLPYDEVCAMYESIMQTRQGAG